jgi:hypothetical protein
MGFELGVDYFDEFEIGRDNSIVISWDYYNDRYKPLYFKSVDIAESYLKDHIVFLSNKTDDAQALMAIRCKNP